MTLVYDTAKDAGGQPVPYATVTLLLTGPAGEYRNHVSGAAPLSGAVLTADERGYWECTLTAQSHLSPGDSQYQVSYRKGPRLLDSFAFTVVDTTVQWARAGRQP